LTLAGTWNRITAPNPDNLGNTSKAFVGSGNRTFPQPVTRRHRRQAAGALRTLSHPLIHQLAMVATGRAVGLGFLF
ncbi:MAG: hypothetical protein ACK523_10005, partial [Pirellulaceae bacterium]